jgi:phosphohistidine swiveling domain-containing protein
MDLHHTSTNQMIVDLSDPTAKEISRVGSKAGNLATLAQAGFHIPRGIVLTTDAYLRFAETTHTANGLIDLLATVIEVFGDRPLAVRSSGIAEDLPDASFAGQYETVLGVRGAQELERAVKRCWKSSGSAHARVYAATRGIAASSMAVLVQELVEADSAGVAFSANPVTGARDQVVINAVPGLGDRLVSGEVSPEEWLVTLHQTRCLSSPESALHEVEAIRVAELARNLEAHFGTPQDIEWAIAGDELFLLQARPITVLPQPPVEPVPLEVLIPDGYWERDVSHTPLPWHPMDGVTMPPTEAAIRRWGEEFGYLFEGLEFVDIGGWIYSRIAPLGGKEGPELPTWAMWLAVRMVPAIRRRIAAAKEAVRSDQAGRFIEKWYEEWRPDLADRFQRLREVDLPGLSNADLAEHTEECVRLFGRGVEVHGLLHGSMSIILFEFASACETLLGWDMATALEMVSGTSSWSTEPSRHLNSLAEIAKHQPEILDARLGPDDDLVERLSMYDEDFAKGFADYLAEHGHVSLGVSGTLGDATLAERPSQVLDLIRGQIETGYHPDTAHDENARMRVSAVSSARSELRGTPEADEFERLLARANRAYPVREDNDPYTMFRPTAATRYALLEVGSRLAARDVLDDREDVLFLRWEEAREALSGGGDRRDLIRRRKGERLWAIQHPGPPSYGEEQPLPSSLDFLPADARLPMEAMLWSLDSIMATGASHRTQPTESVVNGIAASPGSYTGPARVLMDESQFNKLEPGDVLICPITSPPWSVVFPTIGALVTDSGGVLSHPAIIAREYRKPAVVATGNATEVLKDGQVVTVDGDAGAVEIVG